MTKDLQEYVTEQTKALMAAPSCCQEAKDAAQAWLDALGTPSESEETKKYIAELEADIQSVDGMIAFASSEKAAELVGAERAKGFLAHAQEIKSKGGKYCDCPACTACANILEKKDQMLA